ncbi:hypothetical protein CEXT_367111 [Caerostris extrusa]|uniref:DUF4283 domain-containing protein n=1 Tax=Caerostris extrusa TaxID=172846 RepID=A0AAV4T1E0_CAEEX|nr:hypothetical protein CEXT_367111 [Caerostris extrusa]
MVHYEINKTKNACFLEFAVFWEKPKIILPRDQFRVFYQIIIFSEFDDWIGLFFKVKLQCRRTVEFLPFVSNVDVACLWCEIPYFPLPDIVRNYNFIGCLPLEKRTSGTRAPKKRGIVK